MGGNVLEVPETITAGWLEDAGACAGRVEQFRDAFPKGLKFTPANIKKASNAGLPVNWIIPFFPKSESLYHKLRDKRPTETESTRAYYAGRKQDLLAALAPVFKFFDRQRAKAKVAAARAKLVKAAVRKAQVKSRKKISAKRRTVSAR